MKIEFVNHASLVVESGGVRMISDPWIEGRCFHEGWGLISKSRFRYEDFKNVTHIWFSHEHPDHFSPPTLKKIDPDTRKQITVLYRETKDKKVVNFCRNLGFRDVVELTPDTWHRIAPDFDMMCCPYDDPWGGADSWSCVRTPDTTLLNINDCDIDSHEKAEGVKRKVGHVDVLATQFSFASWTGNPEDSQMRRDYGKRILEEVKWQIEAVQARYVIPIASFIYFCHQENHYHNADVNRIDEVHAFLEAETPAESIVLYPGDDWTVGDSHSSREAVERFMEDYRKLDDSEACELGVSKPVAAEEMITASHEFRQKILRGSGSFLLRSHMSLRRRRRSLTHASKPLPARALDLLRASLFPESRPARIYITDHAQAYEFDFDRGLRAVGRSELDCDFSTSSEALFYAFQFLWGGQTLFINGRFRQHDPEGRRTAFDYFQLAFRKNEGIAPTWGGVAASLARPVKRRLGLAA